jgi:methylenetetrahydrofolate--tRNA-(uracil-5-)-methyltransferase
VEFDVAAWSATAYLWVMNESPMKHVHVIGGGLAGAEASWHVAQAGIPVILHEMRPVRTTNAHQTSNLAELVCSNSFRSDDPEGNAVGLLHEEMRRCGSLILQTADKHRLPAGSALAVDRHGFSAAVQAALESHPKVTIQLSRSSHGGARANRARLPSLLRCHCPNR